MDSFLFVIPRSFGAISELFVSLAVCSLNKLTMQPATPLNLTLEPG
jgi:hypothetical protein